MPEQKQDEIDDVHAPNGGLVDTLNLDLLTGDQAQNIINFHHDRRSLDKRLGMALIGNVVADLVCWGGFHYRQRNSAFQQILRVQGRYLYRGTGGKWWGAASGLAAAVAADVFGNETYLGTWTQYNDRAYFWDGGPLQYNWDGDKIRKTGYFANVTLAAGTNTSAEAGGSLSAGVYSWVYTYYNPITGEETNPSTVSTNQTVTLNQKINISVPANASWIAEFSVIRLYRTTAGGSTYLFDHETTGITTLSTTAKTDVLSRTDESLGSEVRDDHGPVPLLRYAIMVEDMVVGGGVPLHPSVTYWSEPGDPNHWPPQNAADVELDNGDVIRGYLKILERAYVIKDSGVYSLVRGTQADGSPLFTPRFVCEGGCLSGYAPVVIDSYAYWPSAKGILKFNGQQAVNISDPKIRNRWKALVNGSNAANCFGIYDNQPDHPYYRLTIEDPNDPVNPSRGVLEGITSGGALTAGNYYWVYSYRDPSTGEESNVSAVSLVVAVTLNQRFQTRVLANPHWDSRFSVIRYYRTIAGGTGTYYFDHDDAGITDLKFTDHLSYLSIADASIGGAVGVASSVRQKNYDLIYDYSNDCWIQDLGAGWNHGWSHQVSWLVRDSYGQNWVYQGDKSGRCFRLRTDSDGIQQYTDAGLPIKCLWRSKNWGGRYGIIPTAVEVEYERCSSGKNAYEARCSDPVTITLYRDGFVVHTDSSSIRMFDINYPQQPIPDSTLPDGRYESHAIITSFPDAEWCRRSFFEISSNMTNQDLKILNWAFRYESIGTMLKAR